MAGEQVDAYHVVDGGESRGPLSRADVIALIAKGDVGRDTQIWKAGTETWLAASSFVEFASLVAPPPAQRSSGFEPPRRLDIDRTIEASLAALRDRPGRMCLGGVIYIFIILLGEGVPALIDLIGTEKESISSLMEFVGLVALFILDAGMSLFMLRILRGEAATPALVFSGLKWAKIKVLVPCVLLYGLAVLAGLILLILPGIFLFVAFSLSFYILMDSDLGPVAAMQESWRMVMGLGWSRVFVVGLACMVMLIVFVLAGVLVEELFLSLVLAGEFTGPALLEISRWVILTAVAAALIVLVFAAVYEQARRNRERAGGPAE